MFQGEQIVSGENHDSTAGLRPWSAGGWPEAVISHVEGHVAARMRRQNLTYSVWWDIDEQELSDAASVETFFSRRADRIAPHGSRAFAYWFAPVGVEDAELRLDIDYDAGRAALRWLPDDTHALELPQAGPITVLETSEDGQLSEVPAELAVVSVDSAHSAIAEYVMTGRRPTLLRWSQ